MVGLLQTHTLHYNITQFTQADIALYLQKTEKDNIETHIKSSSGAGRDKHVLAIGHFEKVEKSLNPNLGVVIRLH